MSQNPSVPDPIHLAFECADAIDRLPGQLSALFNKGASAKERSDSISLACLKVQIGLRPVTNYIERNQPHVLAHHVQQTQSILIRIEKCAEREDSDEARKWIAALGVFARTVTEWLRGWAEEQRAAQGQTQAQKDTTSQETGEPVKSKAAQEETASDGATSKEVVWCDDDAEFIPNKQAIEIANGKLSASGLSKLLTATGPIRYMRKGQRCKVHIRDFMAYLKTMASGLDENAASDIADEFLSSNLEERKTAERKRRAKGK